VSFFLHNNLKTIAYICFLLGNDVDWEIKSRAGLDVKFTGQGHFSEGSRRIRLPIRGRG